MKKLLALFLALLMLLSMAACGKEETGRPLEEVMQEMTETIGETEETAPDYIYYPTSVTDQAGRTVQIQSQPQRLVSGYYISTSALIALGQQDKLVGIEAKADKRPIYSLAAPELIELPNVGTAKEFDLEGCIALEPDLVILPMKLKDAAQTMEELGIPVILVNPESRELLDEMLQIFGKALKCQNMVDALTVQMAAIANDVQTAVAEQEPVKVYLAGNSDFLSTAGAGMYQSDLIALAGGENVAAGIEDNYWVEVSYEQVLAWDPACIILASDASYTVEDVLADPALANCTAVKNGNVHQLPSAAESWDSPVPGGVLGAMWMANVLHPEQVDNWTAKKAVRDFYEAFYGFQYPG
ncbi:MAG: ABC transporter substrate-binding protein [Oscillospiraceae bacterium]|nr:ABC transporter substrate-binding protein [Oscillospiraceae bacterium]